MPAFETDGLITRCFLKRNDPREILISSKNQKFSELEKKQSLELHLLEESFN